MTPTRPTLAGRYQLLELVGQGAQGAAWRVHDIAHPLRPLALKLAPLQAPHASSVIREFELLTHLRAPQIAPVYDLGFLTPHTAQRILQHDDLDLETSLGAVYFTRSFVTGQPAHHWLDALPPHTRFDALLTLTEHLVAGIAAAHDAGICHGDIKLPHLLVHGTPQAPHLRIIDFGLGLHEHTTHRTAPAGTPLYMAPEIWDPTRAPDAPRSAADIYALGVTLFRLYTGRFPFPEQPIAALIHAHTHAPRPHPEGPLPRLAGSIQRMLASQPDERPTARQLLDDLGASPHHHHAQPLPFLGRQPEITNLLAAAALRQPLVGLVIGEVGSGKTRLLEQVRWRLEQRGTLVAEVPNTPGPVWQPLERLAAQLAGLSQRPLGPSPFDVAVGDRLALFNRISDWIEGLAPSEGVVLFWDDLDHAGHDLLDWLQHHLARRRRRDAHAPFSLLIASAPSDAASRFARYGRSLELEGLSWTDTEPHARLQLERRGGASPVRMTRVRERFEAIEGHPLLLSEMFALDTANSPRRQDIRQRLGARLSELSDDALRIAATLAASPHPLPETEIEALLGEPHLITHLEQLSRLGLVLSVEEGWRFRWPFLTEALWQAMNAEEAVPILTTVASHIRQRDVVQSLELWLRAAEYQPTPAHLDAIRDTWARAVARLETQHAHGRSVELLLRLLELELEPELHLAAAEHLVTAAIASGQGERVLKRLPDTTVFLRARLLYALGLLDEAAEHLDALTQRPATWYLWRAQVALRQGPYDLAESLSEQGLGLGGEEALGHLMLLYGAAGVFLDREDALERLDAAAEQLRHEDERGALTARLHTFRAMALSRTGALDQAAEAYRRALEEAERASLEADLPLYLLNVGTAYHRQGRLGLAREYYARGTRFSHASVRPSTRALLLANQANIDISLGRVLEARELLGEAREVLEEQSLPTVAVFVDHLEAEADALAGLHARALEGYLQAAEVYREHGDSRAYAEVYLEAAGVALELERLEDAVRWVDVARREIERGSFADLQAHQAIQRARILLAQGGLEALTGIELFRQGLLQAATAADHLSVLRNASHLLEVLREEGMHELAREVIELVRDAWNNVAVGLTRQLRRDFLAHLPDLPLEPVEAPAPLERTLAPEELLPMGSGAAQVSGTWTRDEVIERFYRMLSLNARIINEPNLDKLLGAAMDIALSLSGAERGFLLLRKSAKGGELHVAISRDVDGESIPRAHLKVSTTIAQEVAERREAVVTVNAQSDPRFAEALSVNHLELSSVLCVPIMTRDEVLGTLYLDHRFVPGTFAGTLPRMMRAFADQLALALVGARQMAELEAEKKAHEAARSQVEALLREKEAMLGDLEQRFHNLSQEMREKDAVLKDRFSYHNIIGASAPMQQVFDRLERVSASTIPVVVLGESGTGKELVARAIHFNGPRAQKPFVAFNCGAVTESLLESELFGYVKGAFTGADRDREGFFAAADGGTLFLDELGEMPLSMQTRLLRAIQEGQIRPVGATRTRSVDVRLIAATNRGLEEMVEAGTFRQDLFYRLAAFTVRLPPLRERREDIPLMVRHFLSRFEEEGPPRRSIEPSAMAYLFHAPWPGNVRQLENVLRTAVILSEGDEIRVEDLTPLVESQTPQARRAPPHKPRRGKRGRRPKATRPEVIDAMRRAEQDRAEAARILGVSERTLYRYLAKFGLN